MSRRSVCTLIVEDDADILAAMRDLLEYEGFSVTTARNGEEALALLEEVFPQLILLDLAMPKMDGAAFRKAQRSDPILASIPTVIMSAAHRMSEKTAALEPAESIAKPISFERLLAVVSRYCVPSPIGSS